MNTAAVMQRGSVGEVVAGQGESLKPAPLPAALLLFYCQRVVLDRKFRALSEGDALPQS